jgi:hypothetical protein
MVVWFGIQARAQEKDPRVNPPLPSSEENSSNVPGDGDPQNLSPKPRPDARPLSGAQDLGIGSFWGGRSFLIGSFQFTQGFDTNNSNQPDGSDLSTDSLRTTLRGSIAVQRDWGSQRLTIAYSTGGILYNNQRELNAPVHSVAFSHQITGRRVSLLLTDQFSYLPEASFGLEGFSGISEAGGFPSSSLGTAQGTVVGVEQARLNPLFIPGQTVLTKRTQRISNSSVAQTQFSLSRRASFTVSGGYSFLHFLESGFIENNSVTARAGFDYNFNDRDRFAIIYGVNRVRFEGIDQSIDNHNAHLSYGRQLTGRLAFQLSAGPRLNMFRNPAAGSSRRLSWSAGGSLQYTMAAANLTLRYHRLTTNGSGVLLGAESDVVDLGLAGKLSRNWSVGFSGGYARNRALRELNLGNADERFSTWRGGANLSRSIGRYARLFLSYNVNLQRNNRTSLSNRSLRHDFALGFSWRLRPIGIE